jgi:hypothetical protein
VEEESRNCGARVPRAVAVVARLLERAAERGDAEGKGASATPASSTFRGKAPADQLVSLH